MAGTADQPRKFWGVIPWFIKCAGDCLPGAGDERVLSQRKAGQDAWMSLGKGWHKKRSGMEYRCDCLPPSK
jgi:hypothetical protein